MKAVFHVHTTYSPCSRLKPADIIELCKIHKVDVIAITDHDEIAGAYEVQSLAPKDLRVIIGEEVSTKSGHMLGLFLKEKIAPHMSAEETIVEIKKQGGVVIIPHPFDIGLHEKFKRRDVARVADKIDAIEVFNSRYFYPWSPMVAKKYAQKYNLAKSVGTDAHSKTEFKHAFLEIEEFAGPKDFIDVLKKAKFHTKRNLLLPYIFTPLSESRRIFRRIKNWYQRSN